MHRLISFLGMITLLLIAYGLSKHRKRISPRIVIGGIILQICFALLIFKTFVGKMIFTWMNDLVVKLLSFSQEGARFVFGNLVVNELPVIESTASGTIQSTDMIVNAGAFFAFNVLPTIIFFSSLMSILYYLGVMQKLVSFFAWLMRYVLGTSGSESLSCSANIFVGQTEAPLVVSPYVSEMTISELMAIMTGGFATVAGGVMAAYVGMLMGIFPTIAGHLVSASIMSAPAALVMAKIILPETEKSKTAGKVTIKLPKTDINIIDAAANGAATGLRLALNVGAMLIAFIALIALANWMLGLFSSGINYMFATDWTLSFQKIAGWIFAPIAFIMGVPWKDCVTIGYLIGEKTVVNEFVAYTHLANILSDPANQLSARSVIIATYALCGFSNFSSIAIQIGGIGGIAPERKHDLARIGLRAMIAGTLACLMTATIAGFLLTESAVASQIAR